MAAVASVTVVFPFVPVMAITGLSLILLVVHSQFRLFRVPVTWLLVGLLFGYATLIHYQIGMLLA